MAIRKSKLSNSSLEEMVRGYASVMSPSAPRPPERIDTILEIVKQAWKMNPDMRLWQLLWNAWITYHTEDLTSNVSMLHQLYWTTPIVWWTRWKSWKWKLKYLQLHEIETDHLENILKTQRDYLKPQTIAIFENEYIERLRKIWTQ